MPKYLSFFIKALILVCLLSFTAFFGIVLFAISTVIFAKFTSMATALGAIFALLFSLGLLMLLFRGYRKLIAG